MSTEISLNAGITLRGQHTLSGDVTLLKLFCLPFETGFTLKGKNLIPRGAILSFDSRTLFINSQKLSLPCVKMTELYLLKRFRVQLSIITEENVSIEVTSRENVPFDLYISYAEQRLISPTWSCTV